MVEPQSLLNPQASERDRRLSPVGTKRILSLDGGGVRGILTTGILERVEAVLANVHRPDAPSGFRLCHYFDLIGGTSTGSIIAGLLAMGKSVREIKEVYKSFAPKVFPKTARKGFRIPKHDAAGIEAQLQQEFGDLELESTDLRTGLAICTKRMDTGSPWVLFNHPGSKFWGGDDANKDFKLRDIVRASAAAPYFFSPHQFTVARKGDLPVERGIFVDGAVAGLNNPSMELFTLATQKDYPFHWETGADRLFMLSIGTGWRRQRQKADSFMSLNNVWKAKIAMTGMIQDTVLLNIKTMQTLSIPPQRSEALNYHINYEVMNMPAMTPSPYPLLTYRRLDASLEQSDVEPIIQNDFKSGKKFTKACEALGELDDASPGNLDRLYRIGWEASEGISREDVRQTLDAVDS
ncbi:MAG: patatin-like phospholipase family protein [Verrucomicrobiota bacterium]